MSEFSSSRVHHMSDL